MNLYVDAIEAGSASHNKTGVVWKFSHVKDNIRVTWIEVGDRLRPPTFFWVEIHLRRKEPKNVFAASSVIIDF